MRPRSIRQPAHDRLVITWDDGSELSYSMDGLRRACPCASCRHEREENRSNGLFPLMQASQTKVQSVQPSGHNAIIIVWGDGHKAGIYTWDYLREIGSLPPETLGRMTV